MLHGTLGTPPKTREMGPVALSRARGVPVSPPATGVFRLISPFQPLVTITTPLLHATSDPGLLLYLRLHNASVSRNQCTRTWRWARVAVA